MLRGYAHLSRAHKPWWPSVALRSTDRAWQRWASTRTIKEDGAGDESRMTRPKRSSKATKEVSVIEGQHEAPKKKRGRPRKTATPDGKSSNTNDISTGIPTDPVSHPSSRRGRRGTKNALQSELPPRLTTNTSPHHHNLPTFLRYARQKNLNPNGNVYKGTLYEYTCMRTLASKHFNFELYRMGRANDLGVDLVGWWKLPAYTSAASTGGDGIEGEGEVKRKTRKKKAYRKLKVLLQCKFGTPKPSMIRELEGAYVGAPAGWSAPPPTSPDPASSSSTLALLLCTGETTKGVLAALQRSRWPIGVLQISREGEVKQFLWNGVARERGLEGLGVVVRYSSLKKKEEQAGAEGAVGQSVRLTWMGRVWRA